ncbi:hypothetical protein NIIDMKKI_37090 [Mycobacterium kansasii]|uniref:Uncharacterized protein n=1 Tax=Mycobacterium kansasii TaxID=1768 RepID=A0A7G1IE27_MYCKA|nr:hypothetical protein NIIDMKKI_37090 [Mycobacterium kansasii]
MAGARATGKSIYIAVLIKQMELLCETLSVSMSPTTQASAQAYAVNYEQPLYVQRGLIPPTPTVRTQASHQREPLIFSIGAWLGVPTFVVLRDVAGEDLEAGNTYAPHFRFFADADAVFSCLTHCGSREFVINCRICCRRRRRPAEIRGPS